MNKVIVIAGYHGKDIFKDLKYYHQQEIESDNIRTLNHITNYFLKKSLTTMIIPYPEKIIIWVREGKLTQR